MSERHPSLTAALSEMLNRLDRHLRDGGYEGAPVQMYLAGGMAVHFHCGSRYTEDVDASFSKRMLVPVNDLTVDYVREDGSPSALYFDANYNDTFALMHPDYRQDSVEWAGLGGGLVRLRVLNPLDLAVSKLSRYSEQDREDVLLLARQRYFTADELRGRALAALDYYVGDSRWIRLILDQLADEI